MLLSQTLETIQNYTPDEFASLSDLLSPEITDECLANTGIATVRKRRLPMKMIPLLAGQRMYIPPQSDRRSDGLPDENYRSFTLRNYIWQGVRN